MRERCPTCGYRFERKEEEAFFLGAVAINFVVTEGILGVMLLISFVLTLPDPPLLLLCAVAVPLMIVAPIAFYPISKTLWAAFDLMLHPAEPEELRPSAS